ncbi:MAG: hypothetical protein ABL983_00980, partial [Nitrospira sp.]
MSVLLSPVMGYAGPPLSEGDLRILKDLARGGVTSAQGLDENFDVENEITGATSANPLIVGNGTQKLEVFGDATMGGTIRPSPLGDSVWRCWAN